MNKWTPLILAFMAWIPFNVAQSTWKILRKDEAMDWNQATVGKEILEKHARWRRKGFLLIAVSIAVTLILITLAVYSELHQ